MHFPINNVQWSAPHDGPGMTQPSWSKEDDADSGKMGSSPLLFFALVFALAVPFWLIGLAADRELLPRLPVAALMAICPAIAALILVYRENGAAGMSALLKRPFDFARIKSKIWYLPALLLAPGVALLSYATMRLLGTTFPAVPIQPLNILFLFAVFVVAAIGEELGWSAYATDPLQKRWGPLGAGVLLGLVWAVWHYVPLMEAHRSSEWIAWWTLGTVSTRMIMVWLYNNTGRSVFAVVLLHATSNLAWQLFPVHGSYFDPRINGLIWACLAIAVTLMALQTDWCSAERPSSLSHTPCPTAEARPSHTLHSTRTRISRESRSGSTCRLG